MIRPNRAHRPGRRRPSSVSGTPEASGTRSIRRRGTYAVTPSCSRQTSRLSSSDRGSVVRPQRKRPFPSLSKKRQVRHTPKERSPLARCKLLKRRSSDFANGSASPEALRTASARSRPPRRSHDTPASTRQPKAPSASTNKSDLSIRPVRHQKAERVQAHILVCFLAYVPWKTLEQWQRRAGLGRVSRVETGRSSGTRHHDVVPNGKLLPGRSAVGARRFFENERSPFAVGAIGASRRDAFDRQRSCGARGGGVP